MNEDPVLKLPLAPAWALTVGEAGRACVLTAVALFVLAILGYAFGGKKAVLVRLADTSLRLGSLAIFGAFGCLITLFVNDQFQFDYIFNRADIHTELKYKVAGVWSGQEGSFLLWAVCAAIFAILALPTTGFYRRGFGATYAAMLGSLAAILAYENPFKLLKELVVNGQVHMPPTGNGMVPSLQNYWIVIHPPTIFLGFGSLTILFAYAVSAILTGNLENWVKQARPWALLGTAILGLGICMGGFWAYETLGWGGFWMWDPVENASFVPWLMLVALVHGIIVQVSRKRWHGATLWMGAAPFFAFLYGTYLTRSGALGDTSVHSFANMERTALQILKVMIGVFFLGFGALYAWRGHKLAAAADQPKTNQAPLNRESLYGGGTILLSILGLALAIGMSWPMFMSMAGKTAAKIEEPIFHKVVVWFFVPIMLLMAIAPFVSWRGMGAKALTGRFVNIISVAIGSVGCLLIALRYPSWGVGSLGAATVSMPFGFRMAMLPWVAFLLVICAVSAVANGWRLIESLKRARSSAGAFVSHFGLAVLMAGLIASRGFEQEQKVFLRPERPETALGYSMNYRGVEGKSLYDRDGKVVFDVTAPDGAKFQARPGLFYNPGQDGQDKAFVWPFVHQAFGHDVYMSMGAPIIFAWDGDGHWFRPGETQTIQGITVKYLGLETSGQLGTSSAKFTANLQVTVDGKTYPATPSLTARDMRPEMPRVGDELRVTMLRIDAKDRSAQLQMLFASPIYPIQIFTKPLTGLVWGGTGILFFGGLLSAWSRRRPRTAEVMADEPDPIVSSPTLTTPQDAPVPAT